MMRCLFLLVASLSAGCSLQQVFDGSERGIGTVSAFAVGGQLVEVRGANVDGSSSGTVYAHQLMVREFLPTRQLGAPVVMIPGFGLSSDIYLTTADGREGWALDFVRAGHPVYLVEPANSTRAGINPEAVNAQLAGREVGEGQLFTWAQEIAYRRFGYGPAAGEFFADAQLDAAHWDQLVKLFTPVLVPEADGLSMIASGMPHNLRGLNELLDRTGPAILLVHSAAGVPAFALAAERPGEVLAVINAEPVGCPAQTAGEFPDVPVLSMFADHMEVREQMPARQQQCQVVIDELKSRGVAADMLALPQLGIRGNSHNMMAERNSQQLSELLISWVARNL